MYDIVCTMIKSELKLEINAKEEEMEKGPPDTNKQASKQQASKQINKNNINTYTYTKQQQQQQQQPQPQEAQQRCVQLSLHIETSSV